MPRDISGNYTLPAGNPVIDNTIIETSWANPTMSDIAVQLNGVITRDGLLGPTAPIRFPDGTLAEPAVSWAAEPSSGWFRKAASTFALGIGAQQTLQVSRSGGNNTYLFSNDTNSAGAGANAILKVAGASAEDPRLGFTVQGATDWSIGVDNSDSDKFKLSYSDTLGTNDRVVVDSTGKVGIGTASPTQRLQVGSPSDTGNQYLRFVSNISDIYIGQSSGSLFGLTSGTYSAILQDAAGTPVDFAIGNIGNKALIFGTNNAERMRIDKDGNLIVGMTSPLDYVSGRGTISVNGSASSIYSLGVGGTSIGYFYADNSAVQLSARAAVPLLLATSNIERMSISASGLATFNGGVRFAGATTTASAANCFLDGADSNRIYRSTSSARYKTDIRDLPEDRASALHKLRPILYKSLAEGDDKSLDWFGLIAEEVAEAEPRLVQYTKDPETGALIPDGVQYERISVLLVAEVQRLMHRIEVLEGKPH